MQSKRRLRLFCSLYLTLLATIATGSREETGDDACHTLFCTSSNTLYDIPESVGLPVTEALGWILRNDGSYKVCLIENGLLVRFNPTAGRDKHPAPATEHNESRFLSDDVRTYFNIIEQHLEGHWYSGLVPGISNSIHELKMTSEQLIKASPSDSFFQRQSLIIKLNRLFTSPEKLETLLLLVNSINVTMNKDPSIRKPFGLFEDNDVIAHHSWLQLNPTELTLDDLLYECALQIAKYKKISIHSVLSGIYHNDSNFTAPDSLFLALIDGLFHTGYNRVMNESNLLKKLYYSARSVEEQFYSLHRPHHQEGL